jgi:hypothetical protein
VERISAAADDRAVTNGTERMFSRILWRGEAVSGSGSDLWLACRRTIPVVPKEDSHQGSPAKHQRLSGARILGK